MNNPCIKNLRAMIACVLLVFAGGAPACTQLTGDANQTGSGNSNSSAAMKGELLSTPPYSTKEPEHYRATLITTGSLAKGSPSDDATKNSPDQNSASERSTIAHDGERRRTDYELPAGRKLSLLQTPEGAFLLDTERKLYADFSADENAQAVTDSGKSMPGFSPNELLRKGRTAARYEKLGAETVNGRAAMKYRVTQTSIAGEPKAAASESLIWIDDELQMPVKQEIVSKNGGENAARWSMELRDIETNVPPQTFDIPAGYRKVALQIIFSSNAIAPAH